MAIHVDIHYFYYFQMLNFRIITAYVYKNNRKWQPKMKQREKKMRFLLANHQSTNVPET